MMKKYSYKVLLCSLSLLTLSLTEARQVYTKDCAAERLIVLKNKEQSMKVEKQHVLTSPDLSPLGFFMDNI